ncbi:MAG: ATP-binding cassette domain-containing protein [Taibaiella sp.]|nr:ATP-binding cassette domain-containing protein [Taibaiella sp.]
MQLTLSSLVPVPLKGKPGLSASGIWGKNLVLNRGAQVFVQAPSGTGKTTLLNILYGLRSDYEGQVQWGDNQLSSMSAEALAKLRAGKLSCIFQDMRLFPALTTIENLSIKSALNDGTPVARIEEWLERLGIAGKRDALAATLSFGEQQRVAIIRALLQPFEWLLMDEPFSHLDAANTLKAAALISEVAGQNNAGMVFADLDANSYFQYTQTILL